MCVHCVEAGDTHIHASILDDAELIVDRVEGWIHTYDGDLVAAPSPHKGCMVVYEPEPVVCIATACEGDDLTTETSFGCFWNGSGTGFASAI